MSGQARAVDIIARRLYAAGCRTAFGIPGGEVVAMIDALEQAGINFVLTKHENNAGFMAEGSYHMSGAPGILVTTLGPGLANAVNVIANAYQDRVPLIVLTACIDAEDALTFTHQIFDHAELLRSLTKACLRLGGRDAAVLAEKAVALALADRPGPVFIDLPMSQSEALQPVTERPATAHPAPVCPAGAPLEMARRWLSEAKRPLLIAGLDVMNHDAAYSLAEFARRFDMPVITTYKAKGILPEDDALALGGAGLSPIADAILLPLVAKADLVLLAGYDPIEMRIAWRDAVDPAQQKVIDISAVPNDHFMHRASLQFVAHVGATLDAIADGMNGAQVWPGGEPAAARAALSTSYGQGEEWGPTAIVETVREALPRNAVATVDSGAHRILASQVWPCYEPRGLLQSTALCTMGCALPLAIGAKLAAPERAAVVFTGDAGLEMILGELATARDLALALLVVVFVDRSLALIELKQRAMQMENRGVDFEATDFAAVAQALGGTGVNIDSREDLARETAAALGRDGFTLLACHIERRAYDGRL